VAGGGGGGFGGRGGGGLGFMALAFPMRAPFLHFLIASSQNLGFEPEHDELLRVLLARDRITARAMSRSLTRANTSTSEPWG